MLLQTVVGTESFQMAPADSHFWPCQFGPSFWLSCCTDCRQKIHKGGDQLSWHFSSPVYAQLRSASIAVAVSTNHRTLLQPVLPAILSTVFLVIYFGSGTNQTIVVLSPRAQTVWCRVTEGLPMLYCTQP